MSRLGGIRKGASQQSPGLQARWSKGHLVPTSKVYNANLVYLSDLLHNKTCSMCPIKVGKRLTLIM